MYFLEQNLLKNIGGSPTSRIRLIFRLVDLSDWGRYRREIFIIITFQKADFLTVSKYHMGRQTHKNRSLYIAQG